MKFGKTFVLLLKMVFVGIIWYILVFLGFHISQGPERQFALGDRYCMLNFPGRVVRWRSEEEIKKDPRGPFPERLEVVISQKVTAFVTKEPWVIGKTEKGWFALNTQTHKKHYPCLSESEVKMISGLNFSSSDLITNYPTSSFFPSSYEIIHPWTKKVVATITICWFVFASVLIIGMRRIRQLVGVSFKWTK